MSLPKNPVEDAYDRWAETYDSAANPTRDLDARIFRNQPISLDGLEVLEYGCGTGKNTQWLAKRCKRVLGLDFSASMLEKARQSLEGSDHVQFLRQDLTRPWEVESASVDAVVGNLVLEHIEHLETVFQEVLRVLRPGGWYFFSELHPFKQMAGSGARFSTAGEEERVPTWLHSVSEYVNEALRLGYRLHRIDEWWDEDALNGGLPRLFSGWLQKPEKPSHP